MDRDRGAGGERLQRGPEAVVAEDGGMDAARQLAQLLDGELGLLARLRDELRGRVRIAVDPRLGEPERDGHGDEPLLRAVVQIALDPAPLGVGGGDDPLARGAQIVHPVAQHARAPQLGWLSWKANLLAAGDQAQPAARAAQRAAASARATRSCARRALPGARSWTSTANA